MELNKSQTDIIMGLSENYALLQKCYKEWAADFSSHENVIRALVAERIKCDGIQRQTTFNLHSYHWNAITLPIINKLAKQTVAIMKRQFEVLFAITHEEEQRFVWYWLFFIHPVRHELYYYDGHYPLGYEARLSKLLRSHRMGLKAAKKYLTSTSSVSEKDSFIKACGTTAFKHLLLHPSTFCLQIPDANQSTSIKTLAIGNGELSENEMKVANFLSQGGTLKFDQWLSYAPCAINEGPIFTAKTGFSPCESFSCITEILASKDIRQLKFRRSLGTYFNIDEISK